MKKCYLILLIFILGYSINAQVGINTNDPKATLHIGPGVSTTIADGIIPPKLTGDELLARENRYGVDQDGALVFVTQGRTTAVNSVKTIGVTSKGLYFFDSQGGTTGLWVKVDAQQASAPSTAYSARFSGNGNVLSLALLSNGRTMLNLPQTSGNGRTVYIPSSNVDATGIYNVTESGLYRITVKFRETGVAVNLTNATLDIFKNNASIASAPLAIIGVLGGYESELDNIFSFNAGDHISFGTTKVGLATINLLNVVNADIIIHRVK